MTRIEEEKNTERQMVEIYCHGVHHRGDEFCEECSTLLEYAFARLDHCKFGEQKSTCKKCPVHCYKPVMRQQMRETMRYAGPRMLFYHPAAAIKHLLREF